MGDDEQDRKTVREQLREMVGFASISEVHEAADEPVIGSMAPPSEIYLHFDDFEQVFVDHDGTQYELVETEDGLELVPADE